MQKIVAIKVIKIQKNTKKIPYNLLREIKIH